MQSEESRCHHNILVRAPPQMRLSLQRLLQGGVDGIFALLGGATQACTASAQRMSPASPLSPSRLMVLFFWRKREGERRRRRPVKEEEGKEEEIVCVYVLVYLHNSV